QSAFYLGFMRGSFLPDPSICSVIEYGSPDRGIELFWYWKILCVLIMTCGTIFLMWLGEQIDEFGIGNGISLLIMAGILARVPGEMWQLLGPVFKSGLELGGSTSK